MTSVDITANNVAKISELFPNVITETIEGEGVHRVIRRAIDFDLLRQELSEHLVEGPQERFGIDWPGKRASARAANSPVAKTLRPDRGQSIDFDSTENLFIEGDNLDVLKLLQESYLGKIKLIYIDPPYNTGRDFVYKDDFAERPEEYLAKSGQVDELGARLVVNAESNGRFHSDWLSMMHPRLKLARNLLSDDGVIFVSIDDHEVNNLVKLCDLVFGEENHVATFIWKSKSGGANDSGAVAVDHEYIVCFARMASASPLGLDPKGEATTSYNQVDENGRYALERLDKQNLQYSQSLDYELTDPGGNVYVLTHRDPNRPNAVWRWSRDRVKRDIDQLVFKDGKVYTKNYEKQGTKPRSLFVDERFGRTRTGSTELRSLLSGEVFDNPKPTKLIEVLVSIATREDSIVLDFFAGSGTTAHAVMNVNAQRGTQMKWIAVQISEPTAEGSTAFEAGLETIPDISRERIRLAGANIREVSGLTAGAIDVGFRTFKVDTTNMANTSRSPDATGQETLISLENSVKPDRSPEDLLFQILLDWGLELTLPIRVERIEQHEVFVIDDDALIACFESDVSPGVVKAIATREPLRAVFRDTSFSSDAARINAEQIFREISPSTDVRAI
jgi:adenine-specific DNA-methyltransferase